jgi:hypothetical protein
MVQTQPLSDGTGQLTATVSPAIAGGNVTFLADGVILGLAPVNAEGIAQISGFAANGAIHSITASLVPTAGTLQVRRQLRSMAGLQMLRPSL